MSSRSKVTSSSPASGGTSMLKVIVVCSPTSCSSGAPHDEQKFAPSALRCPHWLQKTSAIGAAVALALDERAVGGGIHQLVELRRIVERQDAEPPLPVGILVEP